MCFSAQASFLAAGLTGSIGLGCLAKTRSVREWPMAAMPLMFAAQQAVEGLLWLKIPVAPDEPQTTFLTLVFLLFAKVFWPVYTPLAVLLIEPDVRRREWMAIIFLAGVAIALYFIPVVFDQDHEAAILGRHIVYGAPAGVPLSVVVMYMLATCAAPLLSSHASVRLFACIVIAGVSLSYAFYWQAFSSVWCFFAAAASAVLLFHFVQVARLRATLIAD